MIKQLNLIPEVAVEIARLAEERQSPFFSRESLEEFLESDDSQEFRENNFHYLYLDCDCCDNHEGVHPVPYWIEQYANDDNLRVQWVDGYFEFNALGTIIEVDGEEFEYVDNIALDEEVEHQAIDGSLVYEYRGASFLRVLKIQ